MSWRKKTTEGPRHGPATNRTFFPSSPPPPHPPPVHHHHQQDMTMTSNSLQFSRNNLTSLWMGDIDPQMDEIFLKNAFAMMGVKVSTVKIIRNKFTGSPLGYGFVRFPDEATAQRVLFALNGKLIPNSAQGKRFKLNTAGKPSHELSGGHEYSVFVGFLSPEVDDITLLTAFTVRYPSTRTAKVILDNEGKSKGFGFVKFSDEREYKAALDECQNVPVVGSKPIRISVALPRNRPTSSSSSFSSSNQITQGSTHSHFGASNIVLTSPHETSEHSARHERPPSHEPREGQLLLQAQAQAQQQAQSYALAASGGFAGQETPGYCYYWNQEYQSYCAYPYYAGYWPQYYASGGVAGAAGAGIGAGGGGGGGEGALAIGCDPSAYSYQMASMKEHAFGEKPDATKANEEAIAKNNDLYLSIQDSRWFPI